MKKKHNRHKTHSTNYSAVSSLVSPVESPSILDISEKRVLECEESSDESAKFPEIIISYLQLNELNHQINARCFKLLSKQNQLMRAKEKARSKEDFFKELFLLNAKNKNIRQRTLMLENTEKNKLAEMKKLRDLIQEFNRAKAESNQKLELLQKINQKQEILELIQNRRNLMLVEKKKIQVKQGKIYRKRKKIKEMIETVSLRLNKTGEINEIPSKYLQASFGCFSEVDTTCEKSSLGLPCHQKIDRHNTQIKELQKELHEKLKLNNQKHLKIQNTAQNLKNHQKTQETLKNSLQSLKVSINLLKSKLKSGESQLKTKEIQLKAKQQYLKLQESHLYDRFSILFHTFSQ